MPRRGPPVKGHKARSRAASGPAASAKRRGTALQAAATIGELPSKAALRGFLAEAKGRVTKSEIARAFGLSTDQRTGVRAHIQQLKAYASNAPLFQPLVAPRFNFVARGVAPVLHQLTGRWAIDPLYDRKILALIRRLYESAGIF